MKPTLEQITATDQQSFCFFQRVASDFAFHWHQHPELELTGILSGRGQRYIGDHVGDYEANDLVLVGPNVPHTWRSEGPGGHRAVVVQFHPDFAGDHFFDLPELRRVRNLLKRSTRGLRFTGSSTRGIAARLEELLEAKPVARLAGLLEILEVLAASRTVETLSSPEGHGHVRAIDEARIARACAHVAANASDAIRLGTVAALVGMSSASFCRYFKCHTGRTFVEYLNEYRVGMACRMLLETDASITEIAFDSGFSNLSNFNRRFKRVKQMTPRAYRIAYLAS